jgi:hypothetical protein
MSIKNLLQQALREAYNRVLLVQWAEVAALFQQPISTLN